MSKALRIIAGVALIVIGGFTSQPWLVGMGASLALGAVFEPGMPQINRLRQQNVMIRSAVKPQEIVYGITRKSGLVTWFDTSGANKEYLWFVITVCEHEIEEYISLWIDEVEIDVSSEIDVDGYVTNAAFVDADSNKLVKTGFYLGEAAQTADAELSAAFTEWDSTHKGNDCAYFWVRLQTDTSEGGNDPDNPSANIWAKGWPRDISVTIKGKKVYDPRLDSTNGGTGTHRYDDESTWEWSRNSVLCRIDYLMSSRFGPGFDPTRFDWTVAAAQADIASAGVSLPDSGAQQRYTIDGVVTVEDTPKDIIESMQSADYGTTLFLPGGIKVLVGAWVASSHTIDSSWLAGDYAATSATATDAAYNAVRGQYMAADEGYALVEFMPRTSSAYETEDGVGRVWQDITLPFVTDEYRAQRLAIIMLKKSRQQTVLRGVFNYRAELVEVMDIVTIDLPGFDNVTFRVVGKATGKDSTVTLDMREEVSTDWDYTLPDLATPPIIPTVTRSDGGPNAPTNLTAATVVNGIMLEWDNPSMIGVSHIEVYASASNNRASATLVTKTRSESYIHRLAPDTERYYWIIARSENFLLSEWHPVSDVAGVYGIAGEAGADGADAVLYYIKPINGTAIQNGTGTLTVEAHKLTGGVDEHLSAGTIKLYVGSTEVTVANGYATGSDGYTGVFDSGDINGAVIVEIKDGPAGTILDTITLVDVLDGADGDPGTAGEDAVYGYIEPSQSLSWSRAVDQSTWSPTNPDVDFDCTFVLAGVSVARKAWRITRAADGTLTGASTPHKDGDQNTARVTVLELDEGSRAMTVKFTYSYSGKTAAVSETAITSLSGSDGADGAGAIWTQLSIPSPVIPCDNDGTNPDYTQIDGSSKADHFLYDDGVDVTTSSIQSIVGGTDLGSYWQKTQNGLTLTVEETTGKYYLAGTGWTSNGEKFRLRHTYGGNTYDSYLVVTKVKEGAPGTEGTPPVEITGRTVNGTTAAGIQMDYTGDVSRRTTNGGAWTDIGDWWDKSTGSASDYSVWLQVIDDGGNTILGSTLETWLALSTSRNVYFNNASGVNSAKVQVTIKNNTTGFVYGTAIFTLNADAS